MCLSREHKVGGKFSPSASLCEYRNQRNWYSFVYQLPYIMHIKLFHPEAFLRFFYILTTQAKWYFMSSTTAVRLSSDDIRMLNLSLSCSCFCTSCNFSPCFLHMFCPCLAGIRCPLGDILSTQTYVAGLGGLSI